MNSNEIRKAFLDYFREQGHDVYPSSSLVPMGDPSVLFASAGMQQFKPFYSGEKTAPHPRIATAQKCVRTSDIESVGDDSHLTFFEMLGNFAFGDYFKRESIEFAWELLVERLGLDPDRIWTTCFGGEGIVPRDDDSFAIWQETGVPAERIRFFGRKENFWGPTGDSGPCGPDTEIHYELRPPKAGHDCVGPNCECERFLELWNLVFNEFYQDINGELTPLDAVGVDTGAGLERWAILLQDTANVYETDLFAVIKSCVEDVLGSRSALNSNDERRIRIIAEHSRSSVFMLADGVLPGNEGRGYVLRRLMRRAVGQARLAGYDGPFAPEVAGAAIDVMGNFYPEVVNRRDHILAVIEDQEERFGRTLDRGLALVESRVSELGDSGTLDGETAFAFHDTYGVPLDLVKDVAAGAGIGVDEAGYAKAMDRQRRQSRGGAMPGERQLPTGLGATEFAGHGGTVSVEDEIAAIYSAGEPVSLAEGSEEALIVLSGTPFYAESGGQVGDVGRISNAGLSFRVTDTQSNPEGTIFHFGTVESGKAQIGDRVTCEVNAARRRSTARNHTATHLLHYALRRVLGEQARQSGSLVAPGYLRFDFNHGAALTNAEIAEVELLANEAILSAAPVATVEQEVRQAVERGALALFGETYGDVVRVVSIGDISKELCGGTHVTTTAEIGSFEILRDESVGSGLRRIEAVTGVAAVETARARSQAMQEIADALGAPVEDAPSRARQLVEENSEHRREVRRLYQKIADLQVSEVIAGAEELGDFRIVAARVNVDGPDALQALSHAMRSKFQDRGDWAFLVGSVVEGRPLFFSAASESAIEAGANAGKIVQRAAQVTGGGGGGRPGLASGGGRDASRINQGLDAGRALLVESLNG